MRRSCSEGQTGSLLHRCQHPEAGSPNSSSQIALPSTPAQPRLHRSIYCLLTSSRIGPGDRTQSPEPVSRPLAQATKDARKYVRPEPDDLKVSGMLYERAGARLVSRLLLPLIREPAKDAVDVADSGLPNSRTS